MKWKSGVYSSVCFCRERLVLVLFCEKTHRFRCRPDEARPTWRGLRESPAVALSSHRQRRAGEQTVPPSAGLKPGITVEHGGYTPPHKAAGTKQTDVGGWVQRTQHHSSETVVVLAAGRTLGRRQQRTRRGSETEEEVAGAAATLADELVFS